MTDPTIVEIPAPSSRNLDQVQATAVQIDAVPLAVSAREWAMVRLFKGERAVLRNFAVLAPGEDADDNPEQREVPWASWLTDHETVYGLTVDGVKVNDDTTRKQAALRLRSTANASPARAMDSNDAKALIVLLRAIDAKLADGS